MNSIDVDAAGAARQMEKCEECRRGNVKQKCTPPVRIWPGQKCDRCLEKGLPCGPNVRSRKRSRGAASQAVSDLTAPATPSNLISPNSQLTPPFSGPHRSPSLSTAVNDEAVNSLTNQQGSPIPRSGIEGGWRAARTDETRHRPSLSCNSHAYLGYLRILYETICNGQRAINPNAFVLRHGQEVHGRLVSMAGNIVQDYKRWLWEFIAPDPNKDSAQTELRLLKAIQGIGSMNTIAGKEMFRLQKLQIYQRLISIYKDEYNEPEVEHYMILLEELSGPERTPLNGDATIASQIADSMKRTSQELEKVSDEISQNLDSPLLDSPWLYKSPTPFSPLHRALRAHLDKISDILAKEENGLEDCDFLKRQAIQVAAECGNTKFLQENLHHNPRLKTQGDILNQTPLFAAAAHGNLEAVQILVRGDASLINMRDRDGATLMDVLVAGGYTDIAKYLLDLGFDVKRPSLAAASPLHTAAERGHIEFCELLLEAEVDATFLLVGPDGYGYTAAMVAHHKSCEAKDSEVKKRFYSLALRIAQAEGPPYYSLNRIQEREEAEGNMAGQTRSSLRSLGPSPFPSDNTLGVIGRGPSEVQGSISELNAGDAPSSHQASDDSLLPSNAKRRLIRHNNFKDSASTYCDSQRLFLSANRSMD